MWAALVNSGIDPVVAGLAIGLTASAYSPSRVDLEEATGRVREFREQPTAALARTATAGLTSTLSPNARMQHTFHPWTSDLIVPLFALANAGIEISGSFLQRAFTSPITLGIVLGYVVGKPVAVVATSWLVTRATHGRVRPPVGWAAVLGSGTLAGIGFTVSLLIATRAFHGKQLAEAKLGALSAVVVASFLTWAVYRLTARMSAERRAHALLGTAQQMVDLIPAVDPARDHIRGPAEASVHRRRVRRLRVSVLRPGGAGDAGPARGHRHPIRLEAPAADGRAPRRAAGGGGRRGGCCPGSLLDVS